MDYSVRRAGCILRADPGGVTLRYGASWPCYGRGVMPAAIPATVMACRHVGNS
ncbi:hypothetical protein [Novacetimonas hansenii]|uniref:hypothetical protein n=1 Tax=Novacetimonas hansenii TaxID=436 RepID=UPI0015B9603F|nr:hypothetical protein [Novacetimonas hansenii]WEQ58670.1 hypothetical protein LV563_12665 [Novacetimonas hansenii]